MGKSVAVGYLARGADDNWRESIAGFVSAYSALTPGVAHNLYVIFKGFESQRDLGEAIAAFNGASITEIHVGDDDYDIGAYAAAARKIPEDLVCFLNSHAEPISNNWLAKFLVNLEAENVGLVGATASYESLHDYDSIFPRMPNIHVRSNAFMISRERFCEITEGLNFVGKLESHLFESGPQSMTRKVLNAGQSIRLVGSNGRGYPPKWWPVSDTFRLRRQENLLVADNQTRFFDECRWPEKLAISNRTWGRFLQERYLLRARSPE